jgi:hypothetical protein
MKSREHACFLQHTAFVSHFVISKCLSLYSTVSETLSNLAIETSTDEMRTIILIKICRVQFVLHGAQHMPVLVLYELDNRPIISNCELVCVQVKINIPVVIESNHVPTSPVDDPFPWCPGSNDDNKQFPILRGSRDPNKGDPVAVHVPQHPLGGGGNDDVRTKVKGMEKNLHESANGSADRRRSVPIGLLLVKDYVHFQLDCYVTTINYPFTSFILY